MSYLPSQGQTNFNCSSNLYQVVNGKDLKVLDPSTGVYATIGSSSIPYNGAGFNSEDGFIYGIGSGTVLVKIDNNGQATNLGPISNFSALSYSGDFDINGNWYSFRKVSGSWICNKIDVSSSPATAIQSSITELSSASNCADISYNPITGKFYGMSGGSLTEFDYVNNTVNVIGDYSSSADPGGYGAVWSDNAGNTYFFNNGTGNIYRAAFDANGQVTSFAFIATSSPNSSNDGMSCPLSAPPVFPEICDNGVDDDGDGLVDCEDPDCTSTVSCGVSGTIFSTDFTCPSGIASYHAFFTNNSSITNTLTVTETLPNGFVFLQDTLEFDQGGSSTFANQPTDGATGTIQWGEITLEGGETVRISYDVTLDQNITLGSYSNNLTATLGNESTVFSPDPLSATIVVGNCPTPNTFDCEPAFYQVYKKRGKDQPNVYGKLDPITGDYLPIAIASDYANALGYDINTGLVFGASGKKFIQLDEDGLVIDLGITFNKKVYRGDINENSEWYGVDGNNVVKIDVSGIPQVVATYTGQGIPGWDIAYNQDGHFYSVHNGKLYQFNTASNTTSTIGDLSGINIPTSGGYGAQWGGSDGYLYASHNSSGSIMRVDVVTGETRIVSSSIDGLSKNDGFSCPTEIPAVYEFDYGDNSRLAQCRVLSYKQDLNNDNLPDYPAVWLGNTISCDSNSPANENSDGDVDDGVNFITRIANKQINISLGLNANANLTAYYCIGIDWDDNGSFDEVSLDSRELNGAASVNQNFTVPTGFINGNVNVRVLISEEPITQNSLSTDNLVMGEVEDYRVLITSDEDCTNGIDDDADGLVDCDDPDCSNDEENCPHTSTTPGGEGGLESNNRLSGKIAQLQFKRNKTGTKQNFDDQNNFPQLRRSAKYGIKSSNNKNITFNNSIEQFIPIDILEGTNTRITSPEHLSSITNAEEVFSVDVFEGDSRVGAVLALTSINGVYEHTKYVCDRLSGSSIEDILTYQLDGEHDFQIAKFSLPSGEREYATSFSIRQGTDGGYELESFWNIAFYTKNTSFYNFQIWANTTKNLSDLTNEILRLLEIQQPINSYQMGETPNLFINHAKLVGGDLVIQVSNKKGRRHMVANGQVSESETTITEPFTQEIALDGNLTDEVTISIGSAYDLGLTLFNEEESMPDVIFLADGAWGTDYNSDIEQVNEYEVIPNITNESDAYVLNRNVQIAGSVKNSVAVFRAFSPSFRPEDLSEYGYLTFDAKGKGSLEITLVKASVTEWEEQPRVFIELNEDNQTFNLSKQEFLNGSDLAWDDLTMVVFDIKGNGEVSSAFELSVNDVSFRQNIVTSNQEMTTGESNHFIYPNPVTDIMKVHFTSKAQGEYVIELFNQEGKMINSQEGFSKSGLNEVQFKELPEDRGLYYYRIHLPNGIDYQGKVIISRD